MEDLTGRYSKPTDPLALAVPTAQISAGSLVDPEMPGRAMTAPGTTPAFVQRDPTVVATPTPGESNPVQDAEVYANTLPFGRHVPPPPQQAMPGAGYPGSPFDAPLPDEHAGPHWGPAREDGHP